MKIQFASDLHLEISRVSNMNPVEETDADVIVLAGDIESHTKGIDYAAEMANERGVPVIYVPGNHEYYYYDYHKALKAMRDEAAKHDNVHLLDNDVIIIGDTRFLGSTLWTDFHGDGSFSIERNLPFARSRIPDFQAIGFNGRAFQPEDQIQLHRDARKWFDIQFSIPFEGKTVVVTHHGPSKLTEHATFGINEISASFFSDLDHLVEKADLWIYGHTHSNLDTTLGKCRLVSNQRGYPGERMPHNQYYDPAWVIEI